MIIITYKLHVVYYVICISFLLIRYTCPAFIGKWFGNIDKYPAKNNTYSFKWSNHLHALLRGYKEVHNFTVKYPNAILDDPPLAGRLRDKFGFAYKSTAM